MKVPAGERLEKRSKELCVKAEGGLCIGRIHYMLRILYKTQELMYKYRLEGASLNIPEMCWENAYDSILNETVLTLLYCL